MPPSGPVFIHFNRSGKNLAFGEFTIAGFHATKADAVAASMEGPRNGYGHPFPVRRADPELAKDIRNGTVSIGDTQDLGVIAPGKSRFAYSQRVQNFLETSGLREENKVDLVRMVYEAAAREGLADESPEDVVPPKMPTYLRLVRDTSPEANRYSYCIAGIYERSAEAWAASDKNAGDLVREPDADLEAMLNNGTSEVGSKVEVLNLSTFEDFCYPPQMAREVRAIGREEMYSAASEAHMDMVRRESPSLNEDLDLDIDGPEASPSP